MLITDQVCSLHVILGIRDTIVNKTNKQIITLQEKSQARRTWYYEETKEVQVSKIGKAQRQSSSPGDTENGCSSARFRNSMLTKTE